MRYAVIIKHPYRDNDYRVDIVDSELSPDEIKREVENEMLGPFEVIAVTLKLDLNRKIK